MVDLMPVEWIDLVSGEHNTTRMRKEEGKNDTRCADSNETQSRFDNADGRSM